MYTNRGFATAIFRHACGHDASPGAKAVAEWIKRHNKAFSPGSFPASRNIE